jgi:hypothetical protein
VESPDIILRGSGESPEIVAGSWRGIIIALPCLHECAARLTELFVSGSGGTNHEQNHHVVFKVDHLIISPAPAAAISSKVNGTRPAGPLARHYYGVPYVRLAGRHDMYEHLQRHF